MDTQVRVTLVANAGVLLRYRDTAILLDALFSEEEAPYCAASPAVTEKLLCGEPPFEQIDYVLFTHLHADHFSEAATREFLSRRQIRGLVLPASGQSDFPSFVKETGTPCSVLTEHTRETLFRLSAEIQITAFRTLHLDRKYHDIPHFCYLIAFGEKKLLFTSDADYTEESFAFLREETVTAAFVNPMFFSDLRRRRFFRGSLPAENIVVYHLPFPADGEQLQRMFAQNLRTWPEDGPPVTVLERELETIVL
jgi:L-ascorbate metabolism protein UlaG (beta-lactamase superfamily)